MRWTSIDSPIGELSVAVDGEAVRAAHFGRVDAAVEPDDAVLRRVVAELRAYFAGELTEFTVPCSPPRGSDFERAVWRVMTRIPYGETLTYGEVAAAVGDPAGARSAGARAVGARAVGMACNRNPIPVMVPCHRIVGAGGKLVGFAGGLDRKRRLLELEAGVAFQRSWA